ncbi:MAG: hypothetical protein KatS3mg082_1210 [Nitrospiraceae bacterium]|nr:MAG: hypothetical protein KatS3mg082_1210 [Nitrospiraceae bacterium]
MKQAQADFQFARVDPCVQRNRNPVAFGRVRERNEGKRERAEDGRHGHEVRPFPDPVTGQTEHQERGEGQEGNQDVKHNDTLTKADSSSPFQ